MRFAKISLRKCFLLILCFAILLLFGFSLRDNHHWNIKLQNAMLRENKDFTHSKINLHIITAITTTRTKTITTTTTTTTTTTVTPPKMIYEEDDNEIEHIFHNGNDIGSISGGNGVYSINHNDLPWYFTNGIRYPKEARINKKTKKRIARLHPYEDSRTDRITNQLMFVPPNYDKIKQENKLKKILLYNGLGPWNVKQGSSIFTNSKCPVDTCTITADREAATTADMILYKDYYIPTGVPRLPKQIYMMYFLECPYHTQHVNFPNVFNWTATYRKDSDVVAPYEKWEYYDTRVRQIEQDKNYALNKTRKVAWFVSNCGARNGRLQYAHKLQKHIQVDIYGACGSYKCSRSTANKCFELLDRDYKFYLAFENSNCKDYITEKFFVNALTRNILPIVMGARPEDYELSAPQKSYIHIDEFASPKELAEFLDILDKNDDLYNSYFKWKGTGEFINTYYWCRLCAMLHDEGELEKPRSYVDINEWWRGPGTCTNGSWRNYKARNEVMPDD